MPRNGRASGAPSGKAFRVPRDPNPLNRSSEAGKESHEAACPQTVDAAYPVSAVEAPAGRGLLDADALRPRRTRIAREIIEADTRLAPGALGGIPRRGVPLPPRLAR